jgi:hypothetical protein
MYAKWQLIFLKHASRRLDGYSMIPGSPVIDLAHQVARPSCSKNQQHRASLIVKKNISDELLDDVSSPTSFWRIFCFCYVQNQSDTLKTHDLQSMWPCSSLHEVPDDWQVL